MTTYLTDRRLATLGADAIHRAFGAYQAQFKAITQRAQIRFETCDWRGMQADAVERLDLYKVVVEQVVAGIRRLLGSRIHDKLVWGCMKAAYSGLLAGRDEWELAETFFNSVTRRIFTTVGVDPQIEFVDSDFETPPTHARRPVNRTYERHTRTATLVSAILADYPFRTGYQNVWHTARLVAARIEAHLKSIGATHGVDRVEMIESVFYRNKGAYLVGRMFTGARIVPLALALLNSSRGVTVDAVLLNEQEINILFSFTRSYFHV
jgi:isocitrate dehydrogenase kinase/phosphatase